MLQYEFDGKAAFVTGGGSGIGEATALTFGSGGASVVVADRVAAASRPPVAPRCLSRLTSRIRKRWKRR